jgi:hypothetical protein
MAAIVLASGATGAGCSKSSSATDDAGCRPPNVELADPCATDDECRTRFGGGWVCRPKGTQVMDGCGQDVAWGRLCAAEGEAASQAERIALAQDGTPPKPEDDRPVGRAYGPRSVADQLRAEAPSVAWVGVEPIRGPGKLEAAELLADLLEPLDTTRVRYIGALHQDNTLAGTVVIRLTVGADGTPDVRLESADPALRSSGLAELLVNKIRDARFPGKSLTGGECSFRLTAEFASSASGAAR